MPLMPVAEDPSQMRDVEPGDRQVEFGLTSFTRDGRKYYGVALRSIVGRRDRPPSRGLSGSAVALARKRLAQWADTMWARMIN